ncbi:MAG: DUF6431 domain-containing protein [Bacillota bacterium]
MIRILPLGNTVKQYLREWGHRSPRVLMNCPECGRRMWEHGSFCRWANTRTERFLIPIYRLLCPDCRLTMSLLPPFLYPHAQFLTPVREAAIRLHLGRGLPLTQVAQMVATPEVGCVTARTVARWVRRAQQVAREVSAAVAARLLELSPGLDLSWYAAGLRAKLGPLRTLLGLLDLYRQVSMALGASAAAFSAGLFGLVNVRLLPAGSGQYL